MNLANTLHLLLTLPFINCSNSSGTLITLEPAKSNGIAIDSSKTGKYQPSNIPAELDAKFETFIQYFSQDSIFQVSRIDFPLKVKASDGKEETETIINKSDFRKLTFGDQSAKTREFDKYEYTFKVNGNKAIIEIRGIDNGICIDIYFEKRNGKWRLVSWLDSSD